MQTFSANEAKTQFGHFIDVAQREPVRVMRRDRVVGVMVSAKDYEAMREFYANRLQHTLTETAAQAEQAGLTPELLDDLLSDDAALSSQGAPAKLVQWALAQHRLVFAQVAFKALLQAPEVPGLRVVSVHEALRALGQ
eukprot:gene12272-12062_t